MARYLQVRPRKTAEDSLKGEKTGTKLTFQEFFHSWDLVTALRAAMQSDDPNDAEDTLWQSSFTLTIGYPEDAIFIVLGLFQVNLNPLDFKILIPNKRLAVSIQIT